jgi:hypothetical protein
LAWTGALRSTDLSFDKNIGLVCVIDDNALVAQSNRHLALDRQPALWKFFGEDDLVDGFQETRTDLLVQVKAAVDRDFC